MADIIDPLSYIVDWDPQPESVPSVASWYTTEYLTITVNLTAGSSVGQPAGFGPEAVGWLLAQGWVMTGTGPRTLYDTQYSTSRSSGSRTFSDGSRMSYSSSASAPVGRAAAQTANFKRTRINPKTVLQHMITEFTKGYNEGRRLNDQRYDYIVRLYAAIVVRTQDELSRFDFSEADYTPLIDQITASLRDLPSTYSSRVDAIVNGLGDGNELAVNERFDELVSKAKADLTHRGLYNSTLWSSTIAEIERQRAIALAEVRDKAANLKLSALGSAADVRAKVAGAILGVIERLVSIKQNLTRPIELRNAAFKDMLDFMERRTDEYPGLADMAKIITQVGYANGGTLVPST